MTATVNRPMPKPAPALVAKPVETDPFFTDWDEKAASGPRPMIPAGKYLAKLLEWGDPEVAEKIGADGSKYIAKTCKTKWEIFGPSVQMLTWDGKRGGLALTPSGQPKMTEGAWCWKDVNIAAKTESSIHMQVVSALMGGYAPEGKMRRDDYKALEGRLVMVSIVIQDNKEKTNKYSKVESIGCPDPILDGLSDELWSTYATNMTALCGYAPASTTAEDSASVEAGETIPVEAEDDF